MKNQSFFESVYQVTRLIPKGKVTTYGAIAAYLGTKSSARMVGWALNASHTDPSIPAHRVVNKAGLLTGKAHFETPQAMEQALIQEGIVIKENQIVNMVHYFWDPTIELSL
jgi:methylated-DNA-protein-cysteine methyltransferase-like protein